MDASTTQPKPSDKVLIGDSSAAIVIGIGSVKTVPLGTLPMEVVDAQSIAAWLLSTDGATLPVDNLQLITSTADGGVLRSPQIGVIEAAFERIYVRPKSSPSRQSSARNRLTIVAVGPGFAESPVRVNLLAADDNNELTIALELTQIADRFKDSGLFDEVILFADIPRAGGRQWVSSEIVFDESQAQPNATMASLFYAFSNHYGRRTSPRPKRRFIPTLLAGLEGAARDASGAVTSPSLVKYLQQQYPAESTELPWLPEILSSGPVPIIFSPASRESASSGATREEGNYRVTEGGDYRVTERGDRRVTEGRDEPVTKDDDGPVAKPSQSSHSAAAPLEPTVEEELYGGRMKYGREAGDNELCLNVEDYANVLGQLFSGAGDGEFCFAVYGPWGRGKTFLMGHVGAALRALQSGYRTLTFSAWKYPSAPEVWVHFYEEFAKAAFDGPWYRAIPNIVRAGATKHGTTKLLWVYALFAFSVIPLGTLFGFGAKVLDHLYPIVGVIGFVLLLSLGFGVKKTMSRLSAQYLTASRHTEKLGLQATIGADLRALLKGWIPRGTFRGAFATWYWIITAGLISAAVLRLQQGAEIEEFAQRIHWTLIGQAKLPFEIALLLGMVCFAAGLLYWLRLGGSSPHKILLVVDDLDRCKPEHLLSVMESIKLLIEDPEVSSRVQVAMLIEEDAMKHAIFEKYKDLTDKDHASVLRTRYDADRLIWENTEKLFTAHLRLPPLTKSELRTLITSFASARADGKAKDQVKYAPDPFTGFSADPVMSSSTAVRPAPAQPEPIASDPEHVGHASSAREAAPSPASATSDPDEPVTSTPVKRPRQPVSTEVLVKSEIAAVLAALDSANTLRSNLGPRAIRAFLFRYQLARLLLNALKIPWDSATLANSLASRAFDDAAAAAVPLPPTSIETDKLQRVVDQVW